MFISLPKFKHLPKTKLYVEEKGQRTFPTLIMLPGGPGGNATVYSNIIDELSEKFHIIAFDPRGCGRNPKDEYSNAKYCTLNDYVDDIEMLRQTLKIGKFTLLGASYGAMAAFLYAINYPEQLDGLITVGGATDGRFIDCALKIAKEKGTKPQVRWVQKLFAGAIENPQDFRDYYQATKNLYFYDSESALTPAQNAVEGPTSHQPYDYHIAVTNNGFKPGGFLRKMATTEKLAKIKAPTLAMVGDSDWINPPKLLAEACSEIKKQNANLQFEIVENCGHFVWLEQPNLFFSLINDFYEKYLG